MPKIFRTLFILFLIIGIIWSCNEDISTEAKFDKEAMLNGYTDLITNSFNELGQEVDALNITISQFNNQSTLADLEKLQDQFKQTILAFQFISVFDIGPIKANLYRSNMAQWPIKAEDIQSSINGNEPITESYIKNLGANQKGLYSMEFLLFENQMNNLSVLELFTSDSQAERRITYLKFTIHEVQITFHQMNALWQDFYQNEFSVALENGVSGAENRLYNQSVAVIDEVINYIRLANDDYDNNSLEPNQENLLLWNSKFTNEAIHEMLAAILSVYLNGSSLGFDDHLNFVNAKWEDGTLLADAIKEKLENAQVILEGIGNIELAIINNNPNIELLEQELKDVLVLYRADMASWLSLLLLVGDNDGD